MNSVRHLPLRALLLALLLLCPTGFLRAEVFGLFTYQVIGGTSITITDYPDTATGPVIIPGQIAGLPVTSIGQGAFHGCTLLNSVTIPTNVTSIGLHAFSGCTGLASVTLPEGITAIGPSAFTRCTKLTSITIPASVNSIGDYAFLGCTGLSGFMVSTGNASFTAIEGALYDAAGTKLLICPGARTGTFSFPPGVTTIGDSAFGECTALTGISIHVSVTSIGYLAFYGCSRLAEFMVAPGSAAYSSMDGSLYDAAGTTILACPGGRTGSYSIPAGIHAIGYGAFGGCTGLTSVVIPASVTSIGDYGFAVCTGLTSLAIPAGVTSIGLGAFHSCQGLTSVAIPASVTEIGQSAFIGCTGLISATIHASVTSIGGSAFSGCTALTSIVFPPGLTTIDTSALFGCTGLKTVLFKGNAPDIFAPFGFATTVPDFTVYSFRNRTGFTVPTWRGYRSVQIDPDAAAWLTGLGLPVTTDLGEDADGDGVSLLMAYALDLDPRENLRGRLPVPVVSGESLSISFYGAAPGVTYRVETSSDLTSWTPDGVTLSAPDAAGQRIGSVPLDGGPRFLRLKVVL